MIDPLEHADPVAAVALAARDGDDLVLHTSGTTTSSRRIVRSARSWVDSFDACARRWDLTGASRLWVPGPMRATMNLFAACVAHHAGGRWQESGGRASHAALTPTQLRVLLDADPPAGLHCIVAGDALAPGLRHEAEDAGLRVSHYYGAAELSMVACGGDSASLRLFDQVTAEVREGVLWVRSPWLSHLAQVEVARDEQGFASVGDLARLQGDHLTILGRPGTVTTAGTTVAVAPVEQLLQQQARGRVVVLGLPHPSLGEVLCCVAPAAELDTLRGWARDNLTGARRPRRWAACDALPATATGKVDRQALRRELS